MLLCMNRPLSVKIYPSGSGGKRIYQVCWYHAGRRERKTFSHEPDAKRFAKQKESELASGKTAARTLTFAESESYLAAEKALAKLSSPVPLHEAVMAFVQSSVILNGGSVVTASQFFADYHRDVTETRLDEAVKGFIESRVRMRVSEFYLRQLHQNLGLFTQGFPGVMLSELKTVALDRWLGGFKWGGRTKMSARRCLVTLGKWCQAQGFLSKSRPTEFSQMQTYKEQSRDIEIFKPEEMERLLDNAAPALIPWLVIGAFCGLRDAEQHRLDWSEVKLARGHIELRPVKTKTGKRRIVPISENARRWLTPFYQESGPVVLYAGNQGAQKVAFRLCKRLGMQWKLNGLRHSFCTYDYARHGNKYETSKAAGNSPEILDRHYLEAATKEDAEAWFSIRPKEGASLNGKIIILPQASEISAPVPTACP